MLPLDLSLKNPNDKELSVDKIKVSLHDIDAPRATANRPCTAADFEVRQIGGGVDAFRLEAKGAKKLSQLDVVPQQRPALGMINRPVNQNGCKGATLTLDYKASGVEVHQMRITRRRGLLVSALLTLVVLATIGAASAFWTSWRQRKRSGQTPAPRRPSP